MFNRDASPAENTETVESSYRDTRVILALVEPMNHENIKADLTIGEKSQYIFVDKTTFNAIGQLDIKKARVIITRNTGGPADARSILIIREVKKGGNAPTGNAEDTKTDNIAFSYFLAE